MYKYQCQYQYQAQYRHQYRYRYCSYRYRYYYDHSHYDYRHRCRYRNYMKSASKRALEQKRKGEVNARPAVGEKKRGRGDGGASSILWPR